MLPSGPFDLRHVAIECIKPVDVELNPTLSQSTVHQRHSDRTTTNPADAEIAAYLFDLISIGIATEVGIYKASSDYLTATGTHRQTLVSSFIAGMEDRICARLDALREEKHSAIQEARLMRKLGL